MLEFVKGLIIGAWLLWTTGLIAIVGNQAKEIKELKQQLSERRVKEFE